MEVLIIIKAANNSWVFLTNVNDSIEEGMLSSILADAGIPVLKKSKGSGAYMQIYTGISPTGIDLYVPENSLDDAFRIIRKEVEQEEESEDNDKEETRYWDSKHRAGQRLIIFIWLVPMALGLVYIIISGLIKLFTAN